MDLGAYAQIQALEKIAEANGIDIPRLRGYRLMRDEKPMDEEYIKEIEQRCSIEECEKLCRAHPFWSAHPKWRSYDPHTDWICSLFLLKDETGNFATVRWDKIHGRKRRILKFEIKKQKRRIRRQYEMWNKYAGREDVLYCHSRMGGNNWRWFDGKVELMNQSWILDRVDDCWDGTYCDFYAKIDPRLTESIINTIKESEENKDE